MRFFIILGAGFALVGCSSWNTLNTDDMLSDAKERSARTSEANMLANWQEENFGVLAAFPGQTFRGEPLDANGAPNPDAVADVQRWQWSADGKQIVITHALEDGSYGGVSHTYPSGEAGELGYIYVTSGGFETVGTMTLDDDGNWEVIEAVNGHETITHVRSRGHERADGALISEADYFSGGEWSRGHGFVYTAYDGDVPDISVSAEK